MDTFALAAPRLHAVVAVPSVVDFYFTRHRFTSLGAKILCNILSDNGLKVDYYNFPFERKSGQWIEIPKKMEYISPYLIAQETGKLSYFTKYQCFGPNSLECARTIIASNPDICFISCFAFAYSEQSIELAQSIKKIKPKLPIILGGGGPSANPLFFIKEPAIDFVLTGEAETSVKIFLSSLINQHVSFEKVPNLFWKESNDIKKSSITSWTDNGDIAVVFSETYSKKNAVTLSTSLTRGCSKKCKFCSQFITHGSSFRSASIKKIKQAIENLPHPSKFQNVNLTINFEDDNILLNHEYFKQVIDLLKNKYIKISIITENGIDYSLLTPQRVDELIHAGMSQFNISLASTDVAIAKKENRGLELAHYQSIIQEIAKHSIPVITYFICGFKDDTPETIANALAFLASQPTIIGISMYYAVPGIENFKDIQKFDSLPPSLCCGSSAYPWNGSLTTQTMITAFRLSRYCNLVKQGIHSDLEKKIIEKIRSERRLYTFVTTKNERTCVPVANCDEELVRMFFKLLKH